MSSQYFAFGVNQEAATVAVREPFEFCGTQVEELVEAVRGQVSSEWLFLATCNRTEVYGYGSDKDEEHLRGAVSAIAGAEWPVSAAFSKQGPDAVEHVLEVACGLRSQVLGDTQIMNQVKTAYRRAHEGGTVGTALHRLMHTVFATAKRVACETGVSRGNPSIASLATRVARRLVAHRRSASATNPVRVLVLGAGEMGANVAQILHHDSAVKAYICNRTPRRAEEIAALHGLEVIPWKRRFEMLSVVDVVFTTTSAREYVLGPASAPVRDRSTVLVVDISVPRNVDPALGEVPGYSVLDIDALQEIDRKEKEAQVRGVDTALTLCREATDSVAEWERRHRLMQPAIDSLAEAFEAIRRQEVERSRHRFDESASQQVEALTRSIMQKLLAIPVVRLKATEADEAALEQRVAALAALFARDQCEESGPRPLAGSAEIHLPDSNKAA